MKYIYKTKLALFSLLCATSTFSIEKETSILDNGQSIPGDITLFDQQRQFNSAVEIIRKNIADNDKYKAEEIICDYTSAVEHPAKKPEIVNEILADIIERSSDLIPYLTRPYDQARFTEDGALIISDEEKYFYNLLKQLNMITCFRSAPYNSIDPILSKETFYRSGTSAYLFDFSSFSQKNQFAEVFKPIDVYEIRNILLRFELNKLDKTENISSPIIIIPNFKGNHASLTVHFLDLEEKRVLASVFLNSFENDLYYRYSAQRFNLKNHYIFDLEENEIETIKKRFKDFDHEEEYNKYFCNWEIPLIDCSFNLQTSKSDKNCAIYSYNYTVALAKLLSTESEAQAALTIARRISANPSDADAITAFRSTFRDKVISLLPQYYNSDGSKKSEDELKNYHMRLRWDLSGGWLKRVLTKNNTSNTSSIA